MVEITTSKKNGYPEHCLGRMRDPKTALEILSTGGEKTERVALCVCCGNHGTASCPHKGNEKIGLCNHYRLDETDLAQTETRVMKFLQG